MNKQLLLTAIALTISITLFSQQGNKFKSLTKKKAGTTSLNFSYKSISNTTNLKSGSNTGFAVSSHLNQPTLKPGNAAVKQVLENGIPIYLEKEKSGLKSAIKEDSETYFYNFFNSTKSITKLKNPKEELAIINSSTDNLGITHIKTQQLYKGVEVYGTESHLHTGPQKDIFTGRILLIEHDINVVPTVTKGNAILRVKADLKSKTVLKSLSEKEKELLEYNSPKITLLIYENRLAYEITIRPNFIEEWKYFIDAATEEIIKSFNNTHSDGPTTATAYDLNGILRTIDTYLEDGAYFLINASETMFSSSTGEGIVLTLNANNTSTSNLDYSMLSSTNNTWDSPSAVSAHYNATQTFKYFKNTFGRNSVNGQGGNIISFVNVAEQGGGSMENAFWNGKAAFYGNGGSNFKPLAGALDVTAHELGHGVVSNTANLEYHSQSGAINETYADIFGAMVDRDNWLVGEDITKSAFSPSGALRDMSDPHNMGTSGNHYWQPNHLSEMYIGDGDNGGVHINSGIGNYAFYLYATAVSKEKAEQVFYRALTSYLTSKSQFIDFRIAVVQSAKDLYGDTSFEVSEAEDAFYAVGIYEDEVIEYEQDYDVNSGQDYLISFDTNEEDANTLYRSSTSGTDFGALSTTDLKGKVCVSDDGTEAIFVSADDKIKGIYTDPNKPDEYFLSDEAFWDNATLSKDGKRLAGISTEIDTAIYVYDFSSGSWAKFSLYNPTTSHNGDNAGGVLYADAIEFDHTGEYIMYDAYNELNSTFGDNISYWDIGFIKVWDRGKDEFGSGIITKLYSSLPEDVSIGNPTFSKNSPDIIAFDYIDNATEEYAIIGANLLSGEIDVITSNAILGFPSFSKLDDKIAFSALNTSDEEVVAVIGVDESKISGVGTATVLIEDAKWPVFYSLGNRSLELEPVANFTVDVKLGNAPLSAQFIDMSINDPLTWSWSFQGGDPSSSTLQNPKISYNSPGVYEVSLSCTNNAGENTITKSSYITVSTTTAIAEQIVEPVSYYPNPCLGKLYVQANSDFSLKIFSQTGSLLLDVRNEKEIDLSALTSGLYILHIECNGELLTNKLVKQ